MHEVTAQKLRRKEKVKERIKGCRIAKGQQNNLEKNEK